MYATLRSNINSRQDQGYESRTSSCRATSHKKLEGSVTLQPIMVFLYLLFLFEIVFIFVDRRGTSP
jgi:hypothetical protein